MKPILTFLTLFLMLGGVASAEYCTEKDDLYKKGTDHLNSLYEFGLKIQKAVKDKNLEAIKAMVKFPMNDKKITKSYLDNKTFDQVFSQKEIDFILKDKPNCNSVGIYKGYMLGPGTIWYDDINGATIIALNLVKK
jgi:hypothetical protein